MRRPALITLVVAVSYTAGGLWLERSVELEAQLLLGVLTTAVLAALLAIQPAQVRLQALAVVAFATVGEIVGSLVWGLYSYRLENLPAFVPPGHGIVYLAGFSVATLAAGRYATVLVVAAAGGAAIWTVAGVTVLPATDMAGGIGCAFLLAVLLWTRRPVYAGVFLMVAALEIYGTLIGTWTWVATVPGLGLSQGNPPSGVASGYVLFDVLALWLVARLRRFPGARTPEGAKVSRPRGVAQPG